ncbi:transporter substrate-binding domain-containing protein [Leptolyngbya sp. CCNP1308]|uniref:substrate-binding periplasmic protein n=1 Tax=Leptolyngbya sp. CCNP1308 TaxID=3110255 RepID=UPI002B204D43|nr:transporter substrate-binding domain-containing protein [Leptolyngbya sp. CCNP1308]MEA5449057.1 transporter substrate-binding domain-containing protein [Leptolyngbya sp. CCNP1308]
MDFTTVHPGQLAIIANDFDARPMSFVQDGDRQGYEPAVARAVSEVLGLEPVWFDCPPEEYYPTLSTGDYDVVWFSQAITQDRRAWADFTRPYGRFDEAVLVREDSPIHTLADLAGKRLGSLAGSRPLALTEALPDLEWVPFKGADHTRPTLLTALAQGAIDALVGDALLLLTAEADTTSLRVAFQMPTQIPFGIGVLPGNRELLEALNQAINQLIMNGTLAKLWAQWISYKPFPF